MSQTAVINLWFYLSYHIYSVVPMCTFEVLLSPYDMVIVEGIQENLFAGNMVYNWYNVCCSSNCRVLIYKYQPGLNDMNDSALFSLHCWVRTQRFNNNVHILVCVWCGRCERERDGHCRPITFKIPFWTFSWPIGRCQPAPRCWYSERHKRRIPC